mmetsp:Transcript_41038/g.96412  ORF Transcript_41038/g.96412 Transcript_41038/m.96412 type:complete len:209 (+) Transcript_41038:291-917(+)
MQRSVVLRRHWQLQQQHRLGHRDLRHRDAHRTHHANHHAAEHRLRGERHRFRPGARRRGQLQPKLRGHLDCRHCCRLGHLRGLRQPRFRRLHLPPQAHRQHCVAARHWRRCSWHHGHTGADCPQLALVHLQRLRHRRRSELFCHRSGGHHHDHHHHHDLGDALGLALVGMVLDLLRHPSRLPRVLGAGCSCTCGIDGWWQEEDEVLRR